MYERNDNIQATCLLSTRKEYVLINTRGHVLVNMEQNYICSHSNTNKLIILGDIKTYISNFI